MLCYLRVYKTSGLINSSRINVEKAFPFLLFHMSGVATASEAVKSDCSRNIFFRPLVQFYFFHHFRVYEIERTVKTPDKYLFPNFETVHWYAAKHFLDHLSGKNQLEMFSSICGGL